MSISVLLLGNFNNNHLGHNVYARVITRAILSIWPTARVVASHVDDAEMMLDNLSPFDAVLVVDGIKPSSSMLQRYRGTCPIYAVGVGSGADEDMFDFIIQRSPLSSSTTPNRSVCHFPDLTWLLAPEKIERKMVSPFSREPSKVGILLSNHVITEDSDIDDLALQLLEIARKNAPTNFAKCTFAQSRREFHLEFIPISTDPTDDDRIVHRLLYQSMLRQARGTDDMRNVTVRDQPLVIDEITPYFDTLDLVISNRYHGQLFALVSGVPVVSLPLEHNELLPIDDRHCGDIVGFTDVFEAAWRDAPDTRAKLLPYRRSCRERVGKEGFIQTLQNLLYYLPRAPDSLSLQTRKAALHVAERLFAVFEPLAESTIARWTQLAVETGAIKRFMERNNQHQDNQIPHRVARLISISLLGSAETKYNWGLAEKLMQPTFNLYNDCEWILENAGEDDQGTIQQWKLDNPRPLEDRVINVDGVGSRVLEGYHRSGWAHVMQHVRTLQSASASSPVFDGYLDETFGWRYQVLMDSGLLPYRKREWTGVFHHTPDPTREANNLTRVFEQPGFVQSLPMCRGLVVLSRELVPWITDQLAALDMHHIPVTAIKHPTEFVDRSRQFLWWKFFRNRERKVIQIGAWLRNTYAIYALPDIPKLTKCALKGRAMDHYFVDQPQLDRLVKLLKQVPSNWNKDADCTVPEQCSGVPIVAGVAETASINRYITGAVDDIVARVVKNHESVQLMHHVDNDEYDQLLSENVVFIQLIDASAVNTVIECVVRNTPLVVNRVAAVVEYLGEDYPLYYDTLEQAAAHLSNPLSLWRAHWHLRRMNKSAFKVESFVQSLIELWSQGLPPMRLYPMDNDDE